MMFQEMDSDGDGGISFQEFLTVMGRKVRWASLTEIGAGALLRRCFSV